MLKLQDIVKDYVNGNNVTHALRGISVTFRDSEFVSILGASGCGKTTSLNIIGGLDRYTSGDLVINGRSTKNYTDRDWDTYRNHQIGFVFQSYNLISHQSILENVELALTIGGVSTAERKERALEALKKVGLEGVEKKKPNQLSGGQCQRVAIARALVNNPEVLLADEPTGALDSQTSVQIMDLLKEVSKDRLVIMVTHNPEIAEKYSTRIIKMKDGKLTSDSNPYVEGTEDNKKKYTRKTKKSSMSYWTAARLSFSNLFSKLKRTILVTIAGSIGIIGVSSVLAVSQGIRDYIASMQDDLLSSYPLAIGEQSVDYTSLMSAFSETKAKKTFEFDPKNPKVGVDSMVEYLMSAYKDVTQIKTNTIDDNLMSFIESIPAADLAAKRYDFGIDISNNLFTDWYMQGDEPVKYSLNGLTQSYIKELTTVDGFSEYANYVGLFTDFLRQLPDSIQYEEEQNYILSQYDIIAGDKNPTFGDDELFVVVDQENNTLTDILLAEMGVYRRDDFITLATNSIEAQNIEHDPTLTPSQINEKLNALEDNVKREFDYDEIVGKEYVYFPQDQIFEEGLGDDEPTEIANFTNFETGETYSLSYDKTNEIWVGNIVNSVTMSSKKVSFVEVDIPFDVSTIKDLIKNIDVDELLENPIVSSILTTYEISETQFRSFILMLKGLDIPDLGKFKAIQNVDDKGNKLTFLISDQTQIGLGIYEDNENTGEDSKSYTSLIVNVKGSNILDLNLPPEGQYFYSAEQKKSWGSGYPLKITSILKLKKNMKFGCLGRGLYYTKAFADKFMVDSSEGKVTAALQNFIEKNINGSASEKNRLYEAYMVFNYVDHETEDKLLPSAKSVFSDSSSFSLADIISSFIGSDSIEKNIGRLRSLTGLKTVINYVEGEKPSAEYKYLPQSFELYPRDFDKKDNVTRYLDQWNESGDLKLTVNDKEVNLSRDDRTELTYEDTISLIIKVIDTLIKAVTAALVAFTSLSLLVSCFMIAVITYISVVERIKEIGVIRSLGGRKRDVASLFIMETLLTGLFSGLFGVAMTLVIQVILNAIITNLFGITIAHLTFGTAIIMVGISVLLSVLSGFIPSQSAAHKDPVVALRTGE